METASNFLAPPPPFPPRTPSRKCASSTSSAPAVISVPTASLAQSFPTSVLLQEQRDEYKPLLHILKEDKLSQVTLDRRHMLTGTSGKEEDPGNSEQLVQNLEHQFLDWPGLYPLLPSSNMHKDPSLSSIMQSATVGMKLVDVEPSIALALAKKALSASKHAAMLYEGNEILEDDLNGSLSYSLGSTSLIKLPLEKEIAVRSTRLQERRSKKRRVSKLKDVVLERNRPRKVKAKRKRKTKKRGFDQNVTFPPFSSHRTKLLTNKEELTLIAQIQDLMKLEEVKSLLQFHIGREPTLAEWSGVVGISCRVLQSQIDSGNSSRERLISANLGLVVHVARMYLRSGVSLPDLFQAGRFGLITSIDRFKPQAGCRFSSYAYWWIRQAVRKAVIDHGRLIRLPEHAHALLSKASKARRLLIKEGISHPTNEQIAKRVNITTEKLVVLQNRAREPISLQQKVCAESNVTLEVITADPNNPDPEEAAVNELMMQHVRNLIVTTLEPRERQIVILRFGIGGGRVKTLTEVGEKLGLSRERVRQLQDRSLGKLKQCMESEGADAFREILYT